MHRFFSCFVAFFVAFSSISVYAQSLANINLPPAGQMVQSSTVFQPALLRGLTIHPDEPLRFDFILDEGDAAEQGVTEAKRLINYFLASLTVPQGDLWVNLSPVEKDRIIPDALNTTELGRDLLAQDYLLKQLSASLLNPDDELGQVFWAKVYERAFAEHGTTDIPVDTFHKVWIVPQKTTVFEKAQSVYIVDSHLKVMLESDYVAERKVGVIASEAKQSQYGEIAASPLALRNDENVSTQILRDIVIPAIEEEINQGQNFSQLRQMFHSLILAQWYQDVFKESVLNKVYSAQGKVTGIDLNDPLNKDAIYQQYMAAYKQGVFNFIREEKSSATQEVMPRKYFSGGAQWGERVAREGTTDPTTLISKGVAKRIRIQLDAAEAIDPEKLELAKAKLVGKEILVVDDHAFMRQVIKEILLGFGEAKAFSQARDAIDYLEAHADQVGAIVTDNSMPPGMNGVKFVQDYLKLKWPSIPVMMATSTGKQEIEALKSVLDIPVIDKMHLMEKLEETVIDIVLSDSAMKVQKKMRQVGSWGSEALDWNAISNSGKMIRLQVKEVHPSVYQLYLDEKPVDGINLTDITFLGVSGSYLFITHWENRWVGDTGRFVEVFQLEGDSLKKLVWDDVKKLSRGTMDDNYQGPRYVPLFNDAGDFVLKGANSAVYGTIYVEELKESVDVSTNVLKKMRQVGSWGSEDMDWNVMSNSGKMVLLQVKEISPSVYQLYLNAKPVDGINLTDITFLGVSGSYLFITHWENRWVGDTGRFVEVFQLQDDSLKKVSWDGIEKASRGTLEDNYQGPRYSPLFNDAGDFVLKGANNSIYGTIYAEDLKEKVDAAQEVGGIDMNTIEMEYWGEVTHENFNHEGLEKMLQNVNGFVPVIIDITPIANLQLAFAGE